MFIFIVVYLRHFYGLDKAGDVERMLFNTYYTNTGTVYCTYLSFSSVAFKDQTVQNVIDTWSKFFRNILYSRVWEDSSKNSMILQNNSDPTGFATLVLRYKRKHELQDMPYYFFTVTVVICCTYTTIYCTCTNCTVYIAQCTIY